MPERNEVIERDAREDPELSNLIQFILAAEEPVPGISARIFSEWGIPNEKVQMYEDYFKDHGVLGNFISDEEGYAFDRNRLEDLVISPEISDTAQEIPNAEAAYEAAPQPQEKNEIDPALFRGKGTFAGRRFEIERDGLAKSISFDADFGPEQKEAFFKTGAAKIEEIMDHLVAVLDESESRKELQETVVRISMKGQIELVRDNASDESYLRIPLPSFSERNQVEAAAAGVHAAMEVPRRDRILKDELLNIKKHVKILLIEADSKGFLDAASSEEISTFFHNLKRALGLDALSKTEADISAYSVVVTEGKETAVTRGGIRIGRDVLAEDASIDVAASLIRQKVEEFSKPPSPDTVSSESKSSSQGHIPEETVTTEDSMTELRFAAHDGAIEEEFEAQFDALTQEGFASRIIFDSSFQGSSARKEFFRLLDDAPQVKGVVDNLRVLLESYERKLPEVAINLVAGDRIAFEGEDSNTLSIGIDNLRAVSEEARSKFKLAMGNRGAASRGTAEPASPTPSEQAGEKKEGETGRMEKIFQEGLDKMKADGFVRDIFLSSQFDKAVHEQIFNITDERPIRYLLGNIERVLNAPPSGLGRFSVSLFSDDRVELFPEMGDLSLGIGGLIAGRIEGTEKKLSQAVQAVEFRKAKEKIIQELLIILVDKDGVDALVHYIRTEASDSQMLLQYLEAIAEGAPAKRDEILRLRSLLDTPKAEPTAKPEAPKAASGAAPKPEADNAESDVEPESKEDIFPSEGWENETERMEYFTMSKFDELFEDKFAEEKTAAFPEGKKAFYESFRDVSFSTVLAMLEADNNDEVTPSDITELAQMLLESARYAYAQSYAEEAKRNKGKKKNDVSQSPQFAEARSFYEKIRAFAAKRYLTEKLGKGKNFEDKSEEERAEINKDLFNEFVVKDQNALFTAKAEAIPPREKNFIQRAFAAYARMPSRKRKFITYSIAGVTTVVAGAAGGWGVFLAYGTQKAARIGFGALGGQLANKGIHAFWKRTDKKKPDETIEGRVESLRRAIAADRKTDIISQFAQASSKYEEEMKTEEKKQKRRAVISGIVTTVGGFAAGAGVGAIAGSAMDHIPFFSHHPAGGGQVDKHGPGNGKPGNPKLMPSEKPGGKPSPLIKPDEPGGKPTLQPELGGKPNVEPTAKPSIPVEPGHPEPQPIPLDMHETAKPGDSVWRMTERHLEHDKAFHDLSPEQKSNVIDTVVKEAVKDPSRFGLEHGANIHIGDTMDFSHLDSHQVEGMVHHAQNLSPDAIRNIHHNNEVLDKWAHDHPGQSLSSADGEAGEILGHHAAPIIDHPAPAAPHAPEASGSLQAPHYNEFEPDYLKHQASPFGAQYRPGFQGFIEGNHAQAAHGVSSLDAIPSVKDRLTDLAEHFPRDPHAVTREYLENADGFLRKLDPGVAGHEHLSDSQWIEIFQRTHRIAGDPQPMSEVLGGIHHGGSIDPALAHDKLSSYVREYPLSEKFGFKGYENYETIRDIKAKDFANHMVHEAKHVKHFANGAHHDVAMKTVRGAKVHVQAGSEHLILGTYIKTLGEIHNNETVGEYLSRNQSRLVVFANGPGTPQR